MSARTAGTLVAETVPPAAIPVRQRARRRRSPWLGLASALIFAFLYLPLVVVVLYSFSSTKVNAWPIKGYTLDWYRELIADRDIHEAVQLSIIVGLCAAAIAVVLGTLAAFALDRYDFRAKQAIRFFVVLPIVLPGIVTGVAMLAFFTLLGWPLSRWTIIIAHATFCVTLVLNNVIARLGQIPRSLTAASADLGASPQQTFWRVTFPLVPLLPGPSWPLPCPSTKLWSPFS
jgi:ABC-type spermidine/putrescine transport system permease subunit II